MEYEAVLRMPLRTFWSYNRQVDRLRAEEDQRRFRLMSAVQSPDGAKSLIEALNIELASPVVIEKVFDAEKFEELRQKFANGL